MGAKNVEPNSIRHEAMPSCTVILCTRRGLSAARNLGIRTSTSEFLAFIDDNAVCEPDWLSTAVPLFGGDRVLAVTGKIVFQANGAWNSTPGQVFDPGNHIVGRETAEWFGAANFGGLGLGSNFLVRRAAFDLVGWFDERLGRGSLISSGEENDFLSRIIDAGYRVATCSDSVVRHPVLEASCSKDAFRAISASTTMFTMLAVEHPRHLAQLIRYLWGAIWRLPLPWRERPRRIFDNMAPRWVVYSALASGPFIYIWAALRHAFSRTARPTTAST